MVHVGVKEIEGVLSLLVAEVAPGTHALAGSVPAQYRLGGVFGQPERAAFQQHVAVLLIEYWRVLATLFTIVAAHAHVSVFGHTSYHIVQLFLLNLLAAKEAWVFKLYLLTQILITCLPAVAVLVVATVNITDVVTTYHQILCRDHQGHHQEQDHQKILFHCYY